MTVKIQIISIVFSILLALAVLGLTRKKMIRIKYTLFWLVMSFAFFVLSLSDKIFFLLAETIGVYGPVNSVFLMGFVCVLLLLFNFSVIISGLSQENRKLILKLSLLTWRVEEVERGLTIEDEGK